MPLFCPPINDAEASIRYTTGAVFEKKGSSATHNFVYSFINGAIEKPPVRDPWAYLRNTKIPSLLIYVSNNILAGDFMKHD